MLKLNYIGDWGLGISARPGRPRRGRDRRRRGESRAGGDSRSLGPAGPPPTAQLSAAARTAWGRARARRPPTRPSTPSGSAHSRPAPAE